MKNIKDIKKVILHFFPATWIKKLSGKQRFYLYVFMGALFVVLIPLAIATLQRPSQSEAAWYNDNWLYRAEIPISAHTSAENNVYITVTLDTATPITAGKMQTDCGDLRFTKNNGELLPYFINASPGCNNVATTVQVNFDVFPAGAQTIYYYYGNPSAPNGFNSSAFSTAASGATIGSIGSEAQGKGPVAYWKFDDGFGTVASDSASLKNNGNLLGTTKPTWQTEDQCISGKCLYFDGSTSYASINTNTFDGLTNLTTSGWVKITGTNTDNTLISALKTGTSHYWSFYISGTLTSITAVTGACSYAPSYTFTQGKWYHLAATKSAGTISIYVNGVLIGSSSTACTGAIATNTGDTRIGAQHNESRLLKGFIDDVKIYPYARSAAEVKTDYASRGSIKGVSASLSSLAANQGSTLSNGLVGYWKQDEATWSGTTNEVVDSSGNGNHGTANGATGAKAYPGTGKFGNGGVFDGVDDFAQMGTAAPALSEIAGSQLTVSAWIKPANVTGGKYIAIKNGPFLFYLSGANLVGAIYTGSWTTNTGSVSISANQWSHVVMTYDGSNIKLYVNGALDTTTAKTGSLSGDGCVEIGRYNNGNCDGAPGSYFNGNLDDIRIYNRTLSPAEVSQLYNWAPGPLLNYQFEEKSGTSANDSSGNGNNGTINGAPAWASAKYGSGLKTNGSSTFVSKASASSFDFDGKDFTVEAWIKPNAAVGDVEAGIVCLSSGSGGTTQWCLVTDNDDYVFYTDADGSWSFTDAASTTDDVDTNWVHLAGVYTNGSSLKLYKNGVLMSTDNSITSDLYNPASPVIWVGRGVDHGYFNGVIDGVKIYNYARSSKQVVEDMNASHPAGGSPVGSQIGYWKMDEGYGTTAYDTIKTKDGTLTNGTSGSIPTWNMSGKFGKALSFSRTNKSKVNISGNTAFCPTSVTLSGWFYRTETGYNHAILGAWWGSWGEVIVNTSNKLNWQWQESNETTWHSLTSNTTIALNTWYHFALTADKTTGTGYLYINGRREDTETSIVDIERAGGCSYTSIGATGESEANNPYWFSGMIDDIKIYSYPLTADEVKLDYNKGSAMVLGTLSDTSGLTGGSVASTSASALYCIPGDTATCTPPVGEWNFEEKQGTTANDISGNGNTCTLTGGPTWVSGKVGSANGYTNPTANYLDCGNNSTLSVGTGDFTVSAWIYPTYWASSNEYSFIYRDNDAGNDNGYEFELNTYSRSANQYTVSAYTLDTTAPGYRDMGNSSFIISKNTWSHITAVRQGTSLTWYLNGVKYDTDTNAATGTDFNTTSNFMIGKTAWGSTHQYQGKIDQVKLYTYARSAAQIAWDYNRGGPVGWWKMDECQGSTAYDKSGNNNNGTITIGATGTQTAIGTCTTPTDGTGAWYNGASGKYNASLKFDGTDDSVTTSYIYPDYTNGITMTSWFKTTYSGGANALLFGNGTGTGSKNTMLYIDGSENKVHFAGNIVAGAIFNLTCSTSAVNDGNWHLAIGVWDGTTGANGVKCYIDGKQVGTATSTNTNASSASVAFQIGAWNSTTIPFTGQIDDARVYNYALTAQQVKMLYNENSAIRFGPSSGNP